MSAISKDFNAYVSAFDGLSTRRKDEPSWLRAFRENSFELFQAVGFPSVEEEEWKYTNVAAIARTNLTPVIHANGTKLTRESLRPWMYDEAPVRLVFVDGVFRRDLSSIGELANEVIAIDLEDAATDSRFEGELQRLFEGSAEGANGFVALNNALFSGGLFLRLARNFTANAPIHRVLVT